MQYGLNMHRSIQESEGIADLNSFHYPNWLLPTLFSYPLVATHAETVYNMRDKIRPELRKIAVSVASNTG